MSYVILKPKMHGRRLKNFYRMIAFLQGVVSYTLPQDWYKCPGVRVNVVLLPDIFEALNDNTWSARKVARIWGHQ